MPGGGTTTGSGPQGLPCGVRKITDARCAAQCHTSPPNFGAPVSLVSWEDFHRQAVLDPAHKVYEAAAERLHRSGSGRMPQNDTLSSADLATLDAWLGQGAPPGEDCGGGTTPPPAGDAGAGDPGQPRYDAALPDAPLDEGTDCVEFRAHGQQSPQDLSPFAHTPLIPVAEEFYYCFSFNSPWKMPVQGLQFSTLIDNSRVLHHWLLYQNSQSTQDGSSSLCGGQHPSQALVTGWAPGQSALQLPADVGLELAPPTGSYVLEIHYNNPSAQPFQDRSGIRICASKTFRAKTASITWAGTERISIPPRSQANASGMCRPGRAGLNATDPIHIFAAWPHMHKTGIHMLTVINRASGGQETLLDQPFSFDSQRTYDVAAVINPGDSLLTTCSYDNTTTAAIGFGPSTTQEMCYDFLYAYPAHALDHPPVGMVVSSAATNLCTDN
jgi:copper type II ascorbate-dependent monooxygenase-like protein